MTDAFANRYFRAAVIYALIGMGWGIVMAASHDHSTYPAHAHLNLLGWVSMAIYGMIYRLCPKAAEGMLARLHFWLANIGLLIMIPGVWLIFAVSEEVGEPLATVGSLITIVSMAVFAITVWRGTAGARAG